MPTPLDQPALDLPPDGTPAAHVRGGYGRKAMVLFLDGTWRPCQVVVWGQDESGAWTRVMLQWRPSGLRGRLSGKRCRTMYLYDADRMRGVNPP